MRTWAQNGAQQLLPLTARWCPHHPKPLRAKETLVTTIRCCECSNTIVHISQLLTSSLFIKCTTLSPRCFKHFHCSETLFHWSFCIIALFHLPIYRLIVPSSCFIISLIVVALLSLFHCFSYRGVKPVHSSHYFKYCQIKTPPPKTSLSDVNILTTASIREVHPKLRINLLDWNNETAVTWW